MTESNAIRLKKKNSLPKFKLKNMERKVRENKNRVMFGVAVRDTKHCLGGEGKDYFALPFFYYK